MLETIDLFFLKDFIIIPKLISQTLSLLGNIKIHLIVLLAILCFDYLKKKTMDETKGWLSLNMLTVFCIFYVLKISVLRVRPYALSIDFDHISLIQRLTCDFLHSFPSSHAALCCLYCYFFRKSITIRILAVFITSERVLNHRHFFSDVLAGWVLSLLILMMMNRYRDKIWGKIKKGKFFNLPS